ncbi:MAG: FmdB family transcriptional regulator [Micropruina sp.]|nr:FmdB family transcriptional regulator [Micropruina sp.]
MPTYQYRCLDCANEHEAVQKFTEDALTDCPECDGTLRKVYSAVGVVFKGSGFYATDNRSKGSAKAIAGSDAKNGGSEAGPAATKGAGEKSASGDRSGGEKSAGGSGKAAASSTAGSPAA